MKRTTPSVLTCVGVLLLSFLFAGPPTDNPKATGAPPENKILTNSIGMKLAWIPAGKFLMGSPAGEAERDQEEAQHEVTIPRPFYLGIHEVTQREYNQVMPADVKRIAIFNERRDGGPEHPVENVEWERAVVFCNALSDRPEEAGARRRYRLPTEAEWEYACRAGTTSPFHAGKSLSSRQANCNGNFAYGGAEKGPYLRRTAKVGSYPPNAWGLHDLHGNVAEWCADFYDPEYYRKSPPEDPKGPAVGLLSTDYGGFYRVIRGGSWLDEARACRSAYRFRAMPHEPNRLIGFRVVGEVGTRNP